MLYSGRNADGHLQGDEYVDWHRTLKMPIGIKPEHLCGRQRRAAIFG
jgi:hypothetical protein